MFRRNIFLAYLLFFMGGFLFQFHRFYTGSKKLAIVFFLYSILARVFITLPQTQTAGVVLSVPWLILFVHDLFCIPAMVERANAQRVEEYVLVGHRRSI